MFIGHKDQRARGGCFDQRINLELRALGQLAQFRKKVVLFVGENFSSRQMKIHESHVGRQLSSCLDQVPCSVLEQLVIAYQPLWDTPETIDATPKQVQDMTVFIRAKIQEIASKLGDDIEISVPVIFSGSVSPKNAADLILHVDGFVLNRTSHYLVDIVDIAKAVN